MVQNLGFSVRFLETLRRNRYIAKVLLRIKPRNVGKGGAANTGQENAETRKWRTGRTGKCCICNVFLFFLTRQTYNRCALMYNRLRLFKYLIRSCNFRQPSPRSCYPRAGDHNKNIIKCACKEC